MEINDLVKVVTDFWNERDWWQFHNPKDLVAAISIESAELMEHFLWKSEAESYKIASSEKAVDEFADIMNFLLLYANACNIDIESAIKNKIKKNWLKYPIAKSKWVSTKYTNL